MTVGYYPFGDYVLDVARRELRRSGETVALSGRAFKCLHYLIENRHRAVGRDELAGAIFGHVNVSDAQLGQIVLRARRAVGDDGQEQHCIRTIPRFGFSWIAPVREHAAAEASPTEAVEVMPLAVARETTPAVPVAPQPRRRWVATVAAIALVAVLALLGWWRLRDAPLAKRPDLVVVVPSTIDGPPEASWARLGLMDFLANRLRSAGLPVPPSENTLVLLQGAAPGSVDPHHLRRITHAGLVVQSSAVRKGDRWEVSLLASDGDDVQLRGAATEVDLLQAAGLASDRLLAALGHPAPVADTAADPGLQEQLQRAQSAMFANELDAAREILQSVPELQRQTPQLRYRLVQLDFRAGKFKQALDELDRLLLDPAATADALFRARLLNARGAMCMRLQRFAEAERDFGAAVALLDAQRQHAELGQALTGRGVARSAQGDFSGALADLGQARVQLVRAGDPLAVARVDANLGHLELDRERPDQALGYLSKAVQDFESLGAVNELLGAQSGLIAVHLRLLQPDQAWRVSERAWAMRARASDQMLRVILQLDRVEMLMRLGRLQEARGLLDASQADTQAASNEMHRRAFLFMELAWQQGQSATAVRLADAALRDWPADQVQPLRAWLVLRRQQAAQAADMPAMPFAQMAPGMAPSLPGVLAQALALRRAGHVAQADAAYQQAVVQAEQRGIPDEIVETAEAYVPWLIERQRLDDAAALVGRVAPWASRDFDSSLLQARLFQVLGQVEPWRSALEDAHRLAGERLVPASLLVPPKVTVPQSNH